MNIVYGTTMNSRLFRHPCQASIRRTIKLDPTANIILYHENSFELKTYGSEINLDKLNKNILSIDLFTEYPAMETFLKSSPFKSCHLSNNYWKKNSPFWFRKVAAISNLVSRLEDDQIGVWLDCDCFIKKPFTQDLEQYILDHDWLVIYRKNDWIESGFQTIKGSEKTRNFAKKYLDYYIGLKAFEEEEWADNWILDICFKKLNHSLKLNGLTPEFNSPRNINDFIIHYKGPLSRVRLTQKI